MEIPLKSSFAIAIFPFSFIILRASSSTNILSHSLPSFLPVLPPYISHAASLPLLKVLPRIVVELPAIHLHGLVGAAGAAAEERHGSVILRAGFDIEETDFAAAGVADEDFCLHILDAWIIIIIIYLINLNF